MAALASSIITPNGCSSIHAKIKGGFSYMKGIEFEIWTLHYSEYVLKYMIVSDRLVDGFHKKHYANWLQFVQACRIVVQPAITTAQALEARELFRCFCKDYVVLFGPEAIKPNYHYVLHLSENIEYYGSTFNTSCFSLERMNGVLKQSTENRNLQSIQTSYMTNFLESIHISSLIKQLTSTNIISKDQAHILHNTSAINQSLYTISSPQDRINFYKLSSYEYTNSGGVVTGSEMLYSHPNIIPTSFDEIKSTPLDPSHHMLLIEYYTLCYPNRSFTNLFHLTTTNLCNNYGNSLSNNIPSIYVGADARISKQFQSDIMYKSRMARSMKGAYIQTFFKNNHSSESVACFYGEIQYFFQHVIIVNGSVTPHTFAFVRWFIPVNPGNNILENETMEICKGYENTNVHSILPVHRIHNAITVACSSDNSSNPRIQNGCIVIIPQEKKIYV